MASDSSSVLQHVIAILDCFSADQPELGVREAARLAELSSSTTGRLMAEMKELGILRQNPLTRGYALGSRVLVWAGVYADALDLRRVALPLMEDLRRSTSETITLYLLDNNERLCVERLESRQNIRMVTRVGHRLPLYAGSAGKAILAFLPDERLEEILDATELRALTAQTIVDRKALRLELVKIRLQGFAVSSGEWIAEASGVAAPIRGQGGEVLGALTISGPGTRFTELKVTQYADEVVRAAGQISRLMGCTELVGIFR